MKTHTLSKVLFVAFLTLLSYSAVGNSWPPVLDPDPEVQPPKWDWQLAVPVQINPDSSIKIYDIEMLEDENSGAVQMLHDRGYKVICYVDVGSWENWRDDKNDFPSVFLVPYTRDLKMKGGSISAMLTLPSQKRVLNSRRS